MKNENKKEVKKTKKFKASNPKQFSNWYGKDVPEYENLCKGKSVELNLEDPTVKDWLHNKIIMEDN
tara:strand:+ start:9474 stop:9671 length:198 start_codon:yes stop_codon:yes gene_type:complete